MRSVEIDASDMDEFLRAAEEFEGTLQRLWSTDHDEPVPPPVVGAIVLLAISAYMERHQCKEASANLAEIMFKRALVRDSGVMEVRGPVGIQ